MAILAVTVVQDAADFAALEPAWWKLWRRCPAATPFQSPAWLLPWWRHFHPGMLQAVTIWLGEDLVGLAASYLEAGPGGGRLLPVGISLSDYLDALIDPEHDVAPAMLDAVRSLPWSSWELDELRPEAMLRGLIPSGAAKLSMQSACPVLRLSGGDDLAGCVPAKRRRQLRRSRAAAERRGGTFIRPAKSSDAFLVELLRLHGARWRERGETGVLDDASVQAFHREALPGLMAAGLARCHTIEIDGIVVGAYYGFAHNGLAYAYLGGFDPAFGEESPGSLLMAHAISRAIREGATEFHFLRGPEAYKYAWGAVDRWNERVSICRKDF